MLKHYFQLFRISNIFTVPSDILAGYFVASLFDIDIVNYHSITFLVFSSIFLYIGVMVTNDLFDINKDKIERPYRPLSSGKIKESTAISLSILFFGAGILLTLLLNFTSTMIAISLVRHDTVVQFQIQRWLLETPFYGGHPFTKYCLWGIL